MLHIYFCIGHFPISCHSYPFTPVATERKICMYASWKKEFVLIYLIPVNTVDVSLTWAS